MVLFEIIRYGDTTLEGRAFSSIRGGENGFVWASPNGRDILRVQLNNNSITVYSVRNIPFELSITTDTDMRKRVLATIQYDPAKRVARVNDNWLVAANGIQNRMISAQTLLVQSDFMSINIHGRSLRTEQQNRIDMRIDGGQTASLFFSRQELLHITHNGNNRCDLFWRYFNRIAENHVRRNRADQDRPNIHDGEPNENVEEASNQDADIPNVGQN